MISEEPAIFDTLDLYKMNKLMLRNRIRAIEKQNHREYVKNLLRKWGSEELLKKFQRDGSEDLDTMKVKNSLWEVSKFSQLGHLSKIFIHDIDGTCL